MSKGFADRRRTVDFSSHKTSCDITVYHMVFSTVNITAIGLPWSVNVHRSQCGLNHLY